ncbi:GAF domain-containing hybrid sensor histidine kinase/response regulator [Desulfovibrio inopinatus]|uniref:GAF domain-containing hybrid sensor histidine kinase/response regulator n=1 Tax=Desulfovibrio inopinatus TaxID=102109 RepID=UPI000404082B|nr:ATP-binding protein [Desulfovibrio inopinatus]
MNHTKTYEEPYPGNVLVPSTMLDRWQSIVDLLAEFCKVPAALIMRVGKGLIRVFRTSASQGNPYPLGATEHYFYKCGLYCEHVIRTNKKLLVPNALDDSDWKDNPDVPLNMISYLGFPILFPDLTPFGTICVLDNKPNIYSSSVEALMLQFRDIIEFQLAQLCQCIELQTELESYRINDHFKKKFSEESPTNPQDKLLELTKSLVRANQQLKTEIDMRIQVERELKRAQQEAVAASQAKSEFLANMSHEIRTPLNGIMGMLRLLQDSDLNEDQKLYTFYSVQSTRRLTNLLSDILDLSRVEAGKLSLRSSPIHVKECLTAVVTMFKPAVIEKNMEITLHVSPDIPDTLMGDPTRVQQILSNLIGNAVKFTDKGSIEIEAHPLPIRKGGELRILFSISDSGIGIPENKMEIIFSAFEQQDVGYQRKNQGAGLGLAICKKLVELMGGTMAVESIEDKGSVFYCCLPFQTTDDSLLIAPSECITQESKASILLVEDDELSQLVVQKYIQAMGHKVKVANDGKEALEILSHSTFDLVLMDIQMPNLDGISAVQAIRRGKAGKDNVDIPVVALTAYAMIGDKEKFFASGFNGYLAKPMTKEALADVVHQFIEDTLG